MTFDGRTDVAVANVGHTNKDYILTDVLNHLNSTNM
jgi:hypothetical protein